INPPVAVRVPDRLGLGSPGVSSQQDIRDHVQVEQDCHRPYSSIRASSIHCLTVSSSGAGRSVLSKPWTSSADNPRVFGESVAGGGASEASSDSRIRCASAIRKAVGQVFTRPSTSSHSLL